MDDTPHTPGPQPHHDPTGRMETEAVLRVRLRVLKEEHREIDAALDKMDEATRADALLLQRMKRRKLALKDEIARIEDRLLPDIIA